MSQYLMSFSGSVGDVVADEEDEGAPLVGFVLARESAWLLGRNSVGMEGEDGDKEFNKIFRVPS
jgi:hypothetical protein